MALLVPDHVAYSLSRPFAEAMEVLVERSGTTEARHHRFVFQADAVISVVSCVEVEPSGVPFCAFRVAGEIEPEATDPLDYEFPLIPDGRVKLVARHVQLPDPDWDY